MSHRRLDNKSRGRSEHRLGWSGGFTLIELITAVVLFAIAALAVATEMYVAISADTHAGEQTRAVALAMDKLEQLKARPIAQVKSEPARSVSALGEEGEGPYRRSVMVQDGAEGKAVKAVTVSVEYGTGHGGRRKVELYTLVYSGN